MAWFWQSDKPAEELVEKIDEVMEPYRKTPAPDAAKKRDEWEESILSEARRKRAIREALEMAITEFGRSVKAAGVDPEAVVVGVGTSAAGVFREAGIKIGYAPGSCTSFRNDENTPCYGGVRVYLTIAA